MSSHGYQIARHIQRTPKNVLQVEHCSLYPALHRLEHKGSVWANWETAAKDQEGPETALDASIR